jgi:hypothetical protein
MMRDPESGDVTLESALTERVEDLIRKPSQILGFPVVVVPFALRAVEHRLLFGVRLLGDEVGERCLGSCSATLHFEDQVRRKRPMSIAASPGTG